jgi:hypothetical protein
MENNCGWMNATAQGGIKEVLVSESSRLNRCVKTIFL